jgi:membrane protein DedA with SNARE-associated domain
MHGLETHAIDFVRSLFDAVGWFGVVVAMAIESACIPLPSEIIMPLAGWLLVAEKGLGWWGILQASFWGAVGNLIGSVIAYGVGAWGGRPLIERYGRYVLITRKDLDRAERWFDERGEVIVFVSRVLPVVRTFISLPAGIARMPFWRFCAYTFVGAFIWCIPLTWAGYHLGPRWENFRERARFLDYPIALIVAAAVAWFVWHRLRELRHERELMTGPTAAPVRPDRRGDA